MLQDSVGMKFSLLEIYVKYPCPPAVGCIHSRYILTGTYICTNTGALAKHRGVHIASLLDPTFLHCLPRRQVHRQDERRYYHLFVALVGRKGVVIYVLARL